MALQGHAKRIGVAVRQRLDLQTLARDRLAQLRLDVAHDQGESPRSHEVARDQADRRDEVAHGVT